MSKRFGRRQKKALKVKIAELECINRRLNQQAVENEDTLEAAWSIIHLAHKIAPNSTVSKELDYISGCNYSSCTLPQFELGVEDYSGGAYSRGVQDLIIRNIDLYDLEVTMREDGFTDCIHFEGILSGRGKDQRACYRISKEGLQYTPTMVIVGKLVEYMKENIND